MKCKLGKVGFGFVLIVGIFFIGLLVIQFAKKNTGSLSLQKQITPKHIVLINIDSLRSDHMGIYGYSKNTTPFLDSLFRKGVVFDNAIAPGYLTFQTDAAIFSGLYPSENNVTRWVTPIDEKIHILPEILNTYGFSTAAFVSPSLWKTFGWSSKFQTYSINTDLKNIAETRGTVSSWINGHQDQSFLFWHIYDVHIPYMPANTTYYKGKYTGPFIDDSIWSKSWQTKTTLYTPDNSTGTESGKFIATPFRPVDVDYLKASYDTGIAYVDDQLKLFFSSIQNNPVYEDTLFIISAEHGEDLKEHGYLFHGDIYNNNIKVPLVFIYPSLNPSRIKEAVSSLDIMPTILSMLNIPSPETIDGESLMPILQGEKGDLNRSIFTERAPFDEYAITKGEWKYILRNPDKKKTITSKTVESFFTQMLVSDTNNMDEFYNLNNDPMEQHNLIGKGYKEEETLRSEVLAFRTRMQEARKLNSTIQQLDYNKLIPYP